MSLNELLEKMWIDYLKLNPQAQAIYEAFEKRGESIVNDHIALRTFNAPGWGVATLAETFTNRGYRKGGDYVFKEKRLYAEHFEHPDPNLPKVFISELELEKFSDSLQKKIKELLNQAPVDFLKRDDLVMAGRPWDVSYADYEALAQESEYASWVAAHGFRPNHFTVNVNALKTFKALSEVNDFIKSLGFPLNASGGEIKGGPGERLEQSSTMASEIEVTFSDGTYKVPGCYYEFAKRYPLDNGKLYQGFVAASADKIFESTFKM